MDNFFLQLEPVCAKTLKLDHMDGRIAASRHQPEKKEMIRPFDDEKAFSLVGKELGVSRWIPIEQTRIADFAVNTDDPDPAHIDPQWAEQHSPYGTTIAFGFLTISLLTTMVNEIIARPVDEVSTLNYGFDRLRLLSPVLVGRRIRGRFVLKELTLRSSTQFRAVYGVTVEIEGEDKPALVADWLVVVNVRNARSQVNLTAVTS
jgi:acyl dehydratase